MHLLDEQLQSTMFVKNGRTELYANYGVGVVLTTAAGIEHGQYFQLKKMKALLKISNLP